MEQKEWALPVSLLSVWPARARHTLCVWDAAELTVYFRLDALCHPQTVVLSSPTEGSRTRRPLLGFNKTQWRMTSVIVSQPSEFFTGLRTSILRWFQGHCSLLLGLKPTTQLLSSLLWKHRGHSHLCSSTSLVQLSRISRMPMDTNLTSAYVCEIYKH